MSYQNFKEHLQQSQGYEISEENYEDDSIGIKLRQNGNELGSITFIVSEQSTGYKRPTKYRKGDEEENVCSIIYISVNENFQGRGLGYYLMLLASLYTKQNYPNITKAKLDDCSDRSGDVVGNLYFKTRMTPIEAQQLLLPNKVPGSVPLTNKKRSLHIPPICGPERVGNLDDIINASLSKINRGGKSRKKRTKKRKSKKHNNRKSKKNRK